MSSAQNPHGGQEATILSLYTSMFHWGAIVAAPGYADESIFKAGGNPYGVSVTAGSEGIVEDAEDAVKFQAKRTVERSEEHTSELQSRFDLVCRLLLEKKNNNK